MLCRPDPRENRGVAWIGHCWKYAADVRGMCALPQEAAQSRDLEIVLISFQDIIRPHAVNRHKQECLLISEHPRIAPVEIRPKRTEPRKREPGTCA